MPPKYIIGSEVSLIYDYNVYVQHTWWDLLNDLCDEGNIQRRCAFIRVFTSDVSCTYNRCRWLCE